MSSSFILTVQDRFSSQPLLLISEHLLATELTLRGGTAAVAAAVARCSVPVSGRSDSLNLDDDERELASVLTP